MNNKEANNIEEISLLDYVEIIVKRRRMIVRNTILAGLLMALLTFVLPSTYTATTTLLPPDDSDSQGLRGLLAKSPTSFLDLPGMSATSSDIFVEILKSRTVARAVLGTKYDYESQKQDLFSIWGEESKASAISKLHEKTRITSNEQGVITVAVAMRDPDLAAQVAKAYVTHLDRTNQEKSFSRAKNSRIYIEQQLEQTERNLKQASQKLADFQQKFKAVNLEEQTKVAIEKAGEIKGTIMAREVQLEVARQTMKPNNPVILRLQKELDELHRQARELQFGNAATSEEQSDYFIPFSEVPDVGLKFAELIRDVKVQETVWELLNQQYFTAKIQEARDTPTVQVLDEAVPPEKRTSPKRTLLVLVASFLTFMFSIFAAFVMEFGEKIKQQEDEYRRLRNLGQQFREDYQAVKATVNRMLQRFRKQKSVDGQSNINKPQANGADGRRTGMSKTGNRKSEIDT